MPTFKEWQAISAVIGFVLVVLGWMMVWLRWAGQPAGAKPPAA